MAVLERSELQDSPLADLHAIADQLGLEGYRRLRKAELVDAILGGSDVDRAQGGASSDAPASDIAADSDEADRSARDDSAGGRGTRRRRTLRSRRSREHADGPADRSGRGPASRDDDDAPRAAEGARVAEGVVELLGNGSAFLRVAPPEASDEDVYISAAQVRRCELVSGDRVSGPVRTPRRSERYPSLVRIDAINGASADQVSEGVRYDERPVSYPSERLALDGGDRTLEAIEWLTPFGRGSRVVIAGPARAGKTELLRRVLASLATRDDLEVTLVLAGVRPEEIAEWTEGEGSLAPAAALSFAASPDARAQAAEHAIEVAKRTAARGADALVAIDTLDGLAPELARKVLVAARNLRDGGSLTILATATTPLGGETTVIALDPELAGAAGPPLDLVHSGTLRAELLVGQDGAKAIADARAAAVAHRHD
ncbi:MAG TPA: Rho termination factor N-terminal domain-containing protein [Solirubrobacteraceae bacterium]|nr:Rho termination factor N-terminal domain-containing protein [Solirubrobacteraceae bacterium]